MLEKKSIKRRVIIVDKHPLLRRGLSELINSQPDLEVSAEADMPRAALDAITDTGADLVTTGLSFGSGTREGLTLLADIRSQQPDLPVLVVSMHNGPRSVELAIQAGASGYVSKQEIGESLLTAIRTVLDGKPYVSS